MTEKNRFDYQGETKASDAQIAHREILYKLFRERPMPDDQLLIVQGLYMRSSALAKILFLNEMYELILGIPGIIVEFGCWWGQNVIVLENLRAIYEPFNQSRRIVGFDTFSGYTSISEKDHPSNTIKFGGYNVTECYRSYLEELIDYHEQNNVLANVKKHRVIEGDVVETVPKFFTQNSETVVALAYFDMALYEPTKVCMETIKPHLIPGSVIMLDEFNCPEYPGETIAFREIFGHMSYDIRCSRFMNDRTFIIIR
ncbi:MAG: dTDP-6-deoxy-L-hexose 3-O-methyltransferase [Chloroflexi bacterium]|nr:dTDP-6-deoxy-L-hexose 3-O-methyltransferase [Chloroflexota bacterium]